MPIQIADVARTVRECAAHDKILEAWYNPRRRHSTLEYLTSMGLERRS